MTFDFADFNVKLAIAYALLFIVGLLMYIAFYKDVEKHPSKKHG